MNCNGCGKPMIGIYNTYLQHVKEFREKDVAEGTRTKFRSAEFRAMAQLGIWNDCCRSMYLSAHDIDSLIQ